MKDFDQLTDKTYLEPKNEDLGHTDEVCRILSRKGRIITSSYNTMDITGKDKAVNDRDAEAFDILPNISEIKVGETVRLHAFAKKSDDNLTPNDPNVVWESDNWDVAFFTDNGVLHARKIGEAIIKATDIENYDVEPVERTISVIAYSESGSEENPGGNDNPDPGTDPDNPGGNTDPDQPTPTEPEVVKPTPTENTEEQAANATDLANALTDPDAGTSAYTATYDEINNITVPAGAGRSATITGEVQDGATFTNETTNKYVTVTNTSDDPVDVSVITNGGSVYLRGEYNDIYLEGKSLPVSSSTYPNVHGTVSVADTDQAVSVTVNFVGEDCGVTYLGDNDLTISDGVADVLASPTVYAPNATVKMSGKYDEVTATVSDNTLILNNGFHANKLIVLKGNVFVNGLDLADFADEVDLHEDCVVTLAEYHVTQSSNSKLMGSSPANGKIILDGDIELTKGRAYSALASGKEVVDLNGHTWKCGDTRATESNLGSYYLRGGNIEVTLMDSVGGGVFENNHQDYLVFCNGANAVVNVMSGEYRGYTHTLYSLLGTINVYGGTFKLLDAATAERDANGNLKFLLNCFDENYTAGTAKINVYGGKFYEFNPAVTYGEPGGPVSYVAPGYKVVESEEDGIAVFEVVPE